eukprot:GHVH01003788.1.p1 GENE.GHVH01003788.1~~GHVH01003788.1.p1  ORF type:complete len:292 (-),score=49.90 GHVH01003788.1:50-925(-)
MAFIKEVKSSTYFSNFKPKRRRRREGKTDYKARKSMIIQDLSKYGCPKYRFVVRRTNKRIIAQVVYATLTGDRTIAMADSFELVRYGVTVGLTNYSAAYCVGLLCARRLLENLGIADQFTGVEEATGEEYHPDEEEERPFRAILDIGLYRSSKGARVFGAMKGGVDGGIEIPHSISCFPGEDSAEEHLERILGAHVSAYQATLKEEDADKYQALFSRYIKANISPDDIEEMYRKAHAAIRANPKAAVFDRSAKKASCKAAQKSNRKPKLNATQRRERVQKKMAILAEQMAQ